MRFYVHMLCVYVYVGRHKISIIRPDSQWQWIIFIHLFTSDSEVITQLQFFPFSWNHMFVKG